MTQVLVLHRKCDGARIVVGAASIVEVDTVVLWPYCETFDEVCDALNAQHILDDEEAQKRVPPNKAPPVEQPRTQQARTTANDQVTAPPPRQPRAYDIHDFYRHRGVR